MALELEFVFRKVQNPYGYWSPALQRSHQYSVTLMVTSEFWLSFNTVHVINAAQLSRFMVPCMRNKQENYKNSLPLLKI